MVGTALFNLSADLAHLMLDVCVVSIQATNLGQDGLCPIKVVATSFPARRLWAPCDTKEKKQTRNKVNGERNDPL